MLIFAPIDLAEIIDISCSADLPPKIRATVISCMGAFVTVRDDYAPRATASSKAGGTSTYFRKIPVSMDTNNVTGKKNQKMSFLLSVDGNFRIIDVNAFSFCSNILFQLSLHFIISCFHLSVRI